jgi:hypothetical protein
MVSVPENILRDLEAVAPFVEENPQAAVGSPVTAAGTSAIGAAENAATAVPDFLSRLTSANLWIRIVKVMAGLALIISGLVQLTHAGKLAVPAAEAAVLA